MAEVKWIKIVTDVFDNRKIKQIESMPDSDSILVIWFKILCLAGNINENGLLIITQDIPYTEEMLANEFKRPLNTIRMALNVFQKFGMVEVFENVLCVSNWEKYQNVEGMEKIREQTRLRVAKHREKQRKLRGIVNCSYCGNVATGEDHIIAIAKGGTDTDENKIPCCIDCNKIKSDKPLVDFLNNNRERINDDLIANNHKLARFVTLCNVTDCYIVTQGNATDIISISSSLSNDLNLNEGNEIDNFFEYVWAMYPRKLGKGSISNKTKKEMLELGDELIRAIERYTNFVKGKDKQFIMYGSTFFNSGYVDYLDDNYEEEKQSNPQVKSASERIAEMRERGEFQ